MDPKRGEIWLVNLDPTIGAEIRKTRPCIVVSSDGLRKLPLRLVAPITEWKPHFESNFWHVRISGGDLTGLSKVSAIDVLQLRGLDLNRFIKRLGSVPANILDEVASAVAMVVEYQ
jgi:mRNA interferase MazF